MIFPVMKNVKKVNTVLCSGKTLRNKMLVYIRFWRYLVTCFFLTFSIMSFETPNKSLYCKYAMIGLFLPTLFWICKLWYFCSCVWTEFHIIARKRQKKPCIISRTISTLLFGDIFIGLLQKWKSCHWQIQNIPFYISRLVPDRCVLALKMTTKNIQLKIWDALVSFH